jgi:3-methyladenine DNA glycosylase/8-oxoguanine DNA glycosylase
VPTVALDPTTNLQATLGVFRTGRHDGTTRLSGNEFWRATLTPDGPAALHLTWWRGDLEAHAWGPGAAWMLERVPRMLGHDDAGFECPADAHPAVRQAHRNQPGLRIAASGALYHELLPVILAQRVTGMEATRQWNALTRRLGRPAPGPNPTLLLPPMPEDLLAKPAWWYHPFGIEAKRADALRMVARHATRIGEWAELPAPDAASKLSLLHGIGAWTIGSALGPAHGDPDAVPVGDYHVPNMVSWALAREPRGTDARMLDLLTPYAGQRGRVIMLLGRDGNAAPKFGPRQRIQPMYRR